jgi:YidC/Oxa1 family membrane protein insertase
LDNQRNLLLAVVLSGLLIFGWDLAMRYFYPNASTAAQAEQAQAEAAASGGDAAAPTAAGAANIGGAASPETAPVTLDSALATGGRIPIDAPRIAGSINLKGAKIDDVVLKDHREAVEKSSGPVRLLSPQGTDAQYFAQFGWIGQGAKLPSADTVWQAQGTKLTQETPVTLTHDNGEGLTFAIQLSIDANYMLSAKQSVTNAGTGAVVVQPFGLINRTSANATPDEFIVHAGPIGVFGGTLEDSNNYEELAEIKTFEPATKAAWLGFTDRYWLSALIPDENAGAGEVKASFRSLGNQLFRSDVIYAPATLAAGATAEQTTRLFAGAKESQLLDAYADSGIDQFGLAISWGWFRFIEKPMLWMLKTLFGLVQNFGLAIILLTVIIRGLLFPIANKQFASMAAMKAVQPKMKAIQERYKDDKQKQQQEIMELYKKEKVNPLAGCLPLLIQIPIFFALYKVLILAIEMRHEPFIFWLKDLSAPDPAKILNLFGLLPFDPPGFLGIGILAVLLGVTMWLTFRLNPSAMDPVQQQIFNFMPWVLMFVMAPFAAGLLLYWVTSNILTLAQQSYLYSKHPQLRAAIEKEKEEKARAAAREEASKG